MQASGGFAGQLVFGTWKGRNTVRQLVIPSNPKTLGQETSRNRVRVGGIAQSFANRALTKRATHTLTDKQELMKSAPSGFAWNGWLVDSMIGAGGLNYSAAQTAWTALAPAAKTAWDTTAAALTPPITAAYQTIAGGAAGIPLSAGNVFFIYINGLFKSGVSTAPTATPPTYA